MNLDALEDVDIEIETNGVSDFMELDINKVHPNPYNPRKYFDEEKLKELSSSIVEYGLMQPIVVGRVVDKYIIFAGERRYKAHLIAGLTTIKTFIINDERIQELALVENIQREQLTDYETAISIKALLDTNKYPKKQDLANAIGKTSQYISKCLRVLNLEEEVQEEISKSKDKVSTSVMIEISKVEKDKQLETLKKYNSGDIKRDEINKPKNVPTSKLENKLSLQDMQEEIVDIIVEGEIFECDKCGTELDLYCDECSECGEDTHFWNTYQSEREQIDSILELFEKYKTKIKEN